MLYVRTDYCTIVLRSNRRCPHHLLIISSHSMRTFDQMWRSIRSCRLETLFWQLLQLTYCHIHFCPSAPRLTACPQDTLLLWPHRKQDAPLLKMVARCSLQLLCNPSLHGQSSHRSACVLWCQVLSTHLSTASCLCQQLL
jgi:hypothetical protein